MYELFALLQTSEERKFAAECWNPTGRGTPPPFRPT